jgi:hypothetical protein
MKIRVNGHEATQVNTGQQVAMQLNNPQLTNQQQISLTNKNVLNPHNSRRPLTIKVQVKL